MRVKEIKIGENYSITFDKFNESDIYFLSLNVYLKNITPSFCYSMYGINHIQNELGITDSEMCKFKVSVVNNIYCFKNLKNIDKFVKFLENKIIIKTLQKE